MTKGYKGESCSEVIKNCFKDGKQTLSYSQIFSSVRSQGDWTDR